jgi:hypothetical protein
MLGKVYRLNGNAMIRTADNYLVRSERNPIRCGRQRFFSHRVTPAAPSDAGRTFLPTESERSAIALLFWRYYLLPAGVLTGFFLPLQWFLVTVDINPSVLFAVAADGPSISPKHRNVDAQTLNSNP